MFNSAGATALEDVIREMRLLKRLRHENIVEVVETINDPGHHKIYSVMTYLCGALL